MLLAHLLAAEGVESVVVESRSEEYVASRIRAGILEQSTVDLLREVGLGERLRARGRRAPRHLPAVAGRTAPPRLRRPHRPLGVGLRADRGAEGPRAAAHARGQAVHYEVADTALHDLETDRPSVTFTSSAGEQVRLSADVVAGCDGSFGPSRSAVPLGEVAGSGPTPTPGSASSPTSPRRPTSSSMPGTRTGSPCTRCARRRCRGSTSRSPTTPLDDWSDDRIWDGAGHPAGSRPRRLDADTGSDHRPIGAADALVRADPDAARHGCSSPATPPTSSRRPAPRGSTSRSPTSPCSPPHWSRWLRKDDPGSPTPSPTPPLRRVWRCTHFSWWMTTMLHATGDPFDAQLQLSQLRWVDLERGRRHRSGRELRRATDRVLTGRQLLTTCSARGPRWPRRASRVGHDERALGRRGRELRRRARPRAPRPADARGLARPADQPPAADTRPGSPTSAAGPAR